MTIQVTKSYPGIDNMISGTLSLVVTLPSAVFMACQVLAADSSRLERMAYGIMGCAALIAISIGLRLLLKPEKPDPLLPPTAWRVLALLWIAFGVVCIAESAEATPVGAVMIVLGLAFLVGAWEASQHPRAETRSAVPTESIDVVRATRASSPGRAKSRAGCPRLANRATPVSA